MFLNRRSIRGAYLVFLRRLGGASEAWKQVFSTS